ncbi:MAG: YgaP family membrane protein [Burkholderiales bacterium]
MNVNQWVRIFAGAFILLSLALAHFSGQADLSHVSWLWLTAFVGINLFQSGFTKFCPLEIFLKKAGVKESCA